MQAAEEAEAAADLLQKAEAALAEVASAEAAAAETGIHSPHRDHVPRRGQRSPVACCLDKACCNPHISLAIT